MKPPYNGPRFAAGAALCAVLLSLFSPVVRASESKLLSTHVPADVARLALKVVGDLPDTNRLHLSIGLPLRDQAGLDAMLKDIYDPTSPNYHHYLSVAEFTEKFGATKADYEALRAFARKNGLVVTKSYPNLMVLSVDATAADVRRVFHVNLHTYQHPRENRKFYAPDKEPTLDLAVPVLHISGLDDYVLPHPAAGHLPDVEKVFSTPLGAGSTNHLPMVEKITPHPFGGGSTNVPFGGSGPGGTYVSQDFRNAYVPGVSLNGAGQSAALFEYDGYFTSDMITYEQQTGLPNVHLVNVPVDGGVSSPGGASIEVSLDIEMVMAMAPGISTIYVYESPGGPADDMLSRIASDNLAHQVSSSWGFHGDPTTDQLYQEMAAQGQSYFEASGDAGAFDGPGGPDNLGPYSGESPYFTLVGGTELVMNGLGGSYASESVWGTGQYQQGQNWGSTGGICTFYPIPTWQQGIDMTANQGSTKFRNSPDVALTADNIYITFYDGFSGGSGGTSAAAPLWCGFNSLINEQGALYGLKPDGFINPAVYALAKSPANTNLFHDVTNGNNTWPGSPSNFFAVPGYDLCTGWGSPTGSNTINALAPPIAIPVLTVVTDTITGGNGNGVIDFDECNNLNILVTNQGIVGATGVQGILSSTTPGAIVGVSTVTYPDLPPGTAAYSTTAFTLSTEPTFICGTPINLVLIMKDDQGAQTNAIQLSSGRVAVPDIFSNTTPLNIPTNNFVGFFSPVTVSGLESAAKITVSVYAQAVEDQGLVFNLISPNGTTVLLSDFNGGQGANYGEGCGATNVQTTFDDDALTPITAGSAPFVGPYQPQEPLSTFLPSFGTNLNGVWQLQVINEFPGDTATLECWSLNVTPYVCQDGGGQCPGSDLSLTMSASPNPVLVNSNLVYDFTVSNAGPSTAQSVVISQTLPPGVGFVGISNYPAQATLNGTNLTLTIGSLPVYGSVSVSVITIPTIPGLITSVGTVGLTGTDLNPNNNTASVSTLVDLPTADLAVSMTAAPTTVLQGGLVTFTILVTNNGPYTATDVVLTNILPANVNFVSSTTSQGSISGGGQIASLGILPVGTNAVVTVTVSPTASGNITDTAEVGLGALQTDPVSFNNIASFTVTVGPSADLGVSAVVNPATVVAGNNYTYVATVFNNGPSAASDVVFNQTIPGGTGLNASTFVSSSQASATVTNGSITWNVGSLASGASASITNVLKSPAIVGSRPLTNTSVFSVFGQPGDANTNNNVFTLVNLVEIPTITISPVSDTLVSQGSVSNGAINPGETVGMQFYLQNTGNVATTNLQATLQATGGVTLPSGSPQNYGALTPGGLPVGGSFTFVASGTNGGMVVATLALQDGTNILPSVSFTNYFPVVQTFWNTNPIYIPATNFVPEPDSGIGAPYPASIQVSNVTGFVSKVTVTVSNLSHTYPNDIGLLLVSPATNTVLMDAVAQGFSFMTDTTLTFDSTAATPLPSTGSFTSGTYQPADYNPTDVFTNAVAPPYSTNLGSFIGSSANGTWSLYAHDDATGDAGTNYNGWGLTITTITPVNPTNNLVAGILASASQVILSNSVTYTLSVSNSGFAAVNGYLTNILPAGLSFVSSSVAPTVQNGQTNIYNLGSVAPGAVVTITNVDLAISIGLKTNTISAGVPFAAFNVASSSATAVTAVNLPLADLAAGIFVSPTPAIVNSNLTYTLSVTNLGPSNAVASAGIFSLTGLNLVSVVPSQGGYTASNGAVQCSLGTILPGNIALVTVTAVSTNVGTLTNTWSVTTTSTDTNPSNNSAQAVVVVTLPVPIIAAGGAVLLAQGAPANGAINSNQTVTVGLTLTNSGYGATAALVATLQASGGITPITTSQSYGVISSFASGTQPFSFIAKGAPGATVTATLALSNGGTNLPSVSFPFQIPMTASYTNSGSIIIPQFGPATPYPSEILVSGLTNSQGSNLLVSKVTVTLNGFAHTFPHDVNVLLDSPTGQELTVMGHAGGPYSVTNLALGFADSATVSLPVGQLTNGTYLATDYAPVDVFPGLPPVSGGTNFALFNGMSPNGYWSLYVYDDTPGNSGVITGGWSLGLTAVSTVNPAALLAASMISSPNPVFGGNFLNYQITITNEGPDTAGNVVITDALPADVTFSSANVSQGSATNNGNTVICSLGSISNGATATATIRVVAGAAGTAVNTATVSTASTDLYLADSTTVNSTTIGTPPSSELYATNMAGGSLQLTLLGQEGQNYAIQTSANLVVWTSVYTNTASLATGSFIYTDTRTNAPLRFYRAVRLPQ